MKDFINQTCRIEYDVHKVVIIDEITTVIVNNLLNPERFNFF